MNTVVQQVGHIPKQGEVRFFGFPSVVYICDHRIERTIETAVLCVYCLYIVAAHAYPNIPHDHFILITKEIKIHLQVCTFDLTRAGKQDCAYLPV